MVLAGFSVEVNKVSDFPAGAKTLAIVPASCPPSVNAIWLDEKVADHLRGVKQFNFISSKVVKQTMFDMGIQQITDDNRAALAKKLGADAFLIVVVGNSSAEPEGVGTGVWSGGVMTMSSFAVAKGEVELLIVSAQDGKTLLSGRGFGETDWRTEKGVLSKALDKLFHEAFKGK
jgi:hypothetical protein